MQHKDTEQDICFLVISCFIIIFIFLMPFVLLLSFEIFLLFLLKKTLVGENKDKIHMPRRKEISLNGFKLTPEVQGFLQ